MIFDVVAFADVEDVATIESLSDVHESEAHIYQILGTWAGVITFEVKTPATSTWVSVLATNVTTGSDVVSTTANGIFRFLGDGLDSRARFSTDTSGAPQVWRVQRRL